ncbi:putative leucine-rich repeat-containing protein DDB_G0290503 isoform X2 [Periplaneta americana]|uniref:putative leucine-rich repeat-containing protein DDB_G0290503 isoform X2 n=1 Tax=Periplaneta americana TaxID=6978 RepID=UPI0037E8D94E
MVRAGVKVSAMPLLLWLLFQRAAAAPPEPAQAWGNFRPAVSQQGLQNVLISIEERLRALDTLYSPRYTPRWEVSIEQQSRRMETMESRLGRLETLLELRLDKLSESMSARQLKDELSKDQINRKLDSTYERINHRLGYLEARLDVGISKLQSTIEGNEGRMERLESTAAGRQSEVESELADIGSGIHEIKKQLTTFETQQNRSLANNMYNDMWRRTQLLEGLVKDSMSLSNATRRELQEGIRSIALQMGRRGLFQSDRDRQEGTVDIALDTMGLVQRRLSELGRKFDSNFQMLMLAQNLFLESCHRIQLDEPQLETKITKVLERILGAITNRSMNTDHEIQELQELLKSHTTHLTQGLEQTTKSVFQASEQSNEDSKLLQIAIAGIKDQLLESSKIMEEAISDIRDEKSTTTEKLYNIATSLQELQDSVSELSTTNVAAKHDAEKYRDDVMECPESEQIAVEIIDELQRKGITFTQITANRSGTTQIGKRKTMDSDDRYFFGGEDGFGEEPTEDTDETESAQFRTFKSNESMSEEENSEDENFLEGTRLQTSVTGINLPTNASTFQRQHRFDLQANKSSSTNKTSKSPEVTIQIIPHNVDLQSARNGQNQLFGLGLHQFAAIIQDSDVNGSGQRSQPMLTIVHAISQNGENNTEILQRNLDNSDTEVHERIKPNVNASLPSELHYINGTFAYNQSENSDLSLKDHGNGFVSTGSDPDLKSNVTESNNQVSVGIPQIPATSLLIIRQEESNDTAEGRNRSIDEISQNIVLSPNITDNAQNGQKQSSRQDTIISTNTSNVANITHPENVTETQIPELLKRLMELYNKQENNQTLGDFWKNLLEKRQFEQNGTHIAKYGGNMTQNNTSNQEEIRRKQSSTALFNIDFQTIQNLVSALNKTEDGTYEIQRQQYLSRLQELAMDLVNRNEDSVLSTNVTDRKPDISSAERNSQQLD